MFLVSVLLQNSLSQDPHQCLKPTLGGSHQRPLSGSVYITPDLRSLNLELGGGELCVLMSGLIKVRGSLWHTWPVLGQQARDCGSDVLEQLKLAGDKTWGKGTVSSEGP